MSRAPAPSGEVPAGMLDPVWRSRIVYAAGAWNVSAGLLGLFDPTGQLAEIYRSDLELGDPVHAFFFQVTWLNVIGWGVAYLLAARSLPSQAPILLAGALGKFAFFAAVALVVLDDGAQPLLLVSAIPDAIFGVLFLYIVRLQRDTSAP